MAVGTDNVALRDFVADTLLVHQQNGPRRQVELLCRGIAVIKVHLIRSEFDATVGARSGLELAEEPPSRPLSHANSFSLAIPVRSVIAHVRGTLVSSRRHDPSLAQVFYSMSESGPDRDRSEEPKPPAGHEAFGRVRGTMAVL